ncbi:hypothetical protein N657DRAFT_415777 [Parathielavia appendiculata]|uniref:Uncharacterized protein n=1 Tax=Parathielavia appendiculata TaxID=2587402 RepID=A0AAN6Z4A2_9PEZI|nr:hypothetical protein N657DRAFT_415777 [Parathielavia appendiculata]
MSKPAKPYQLESSRWVSAVRRHIRRDSPRSPHSSLPLLLLASRLFVLQTWPLLGYLVQGRIVCHEQQPQSCSSFLLDAMDQSKLQLRRRVGQAVLKARRSAFSSQLKRTSKFPYYTASTEPKAGMDISRVNITLPEGASNHGNPNMLCLPVNWYEDIRF